MAYAVAIHIDVLGTEICRAFLGFAGYRFDSVRNIKGVGLRLERWDKTVSSFADSGVKTLAEQSCPAWSRQV